jgi:hypothetical protein
MCPIGFLMLGSPPAGPAERFAHRKPISPTGRRPAVEQTPDRPASADGRSRSPIPADPPAPPSSVDPIGGGKQASAPEALIDPRTQPWTARWALEDLAMARRTCPPSGWPPASARVRPPDTRLDTVPADQFLLRTPPAVAGRQRTRQPSPPSGRPDTPFKVTASPMGLDPVRTASGKRRTPPAPSVRPCAWPSGHAAG